jgi:hypothetical protein
MDPLTLISLLPPEFRGLAVYVLATMLVNLVFTRFTSEQLAAAVGVWRIPAAIISGCRKLGFDPVPWMVRLFDAVKAWAIRVTTKDDNQDPPASPPMQPPADRQGAPPKGPRNLARQHTGWVIAVACLALLGCPGPAKSPALETAAAGVVFGSKVMAKVDDTCAKAIDGATAVGELELAESIHKECARYVPTTFKALELAAVAIDSGQALSQGQLTCAVVLTVDAVTHLRPLLAKAGWSLGSGVDQFLLFAQPFLGVAERAVCHA